MLWTDILQLGLIVGSLGLVLPASLLVAEGPGVVAALPADHLDPLTLPAGVFVAYLLIGVFAFFGSQDLFQRVYAARNGEVARRGVLLFAGLVVVMATAAVALGLVARGLRPAIAADEALIGLTELVVPPGLVGVVLLGFLALANSDAGSQLLTATSNVTQDLLPALDVDPANRPSVPIERLSAVGIGGLALLIAVVVPDLTTLFGALGSWFAILGIVVIATLYWRRMGDAAAFAGLTVGFLAPLAFVALTGNVRAATMVGIGSTTVAVGVISVVAAGSG